MSRASESRWNFSGRELDSAPGSLSPARPRRKQTRTAARSDRPSRTASPPKAPPGPSEGGSPEREAGLRLETASKKSGPPRVGFARSIVSRASENRWHLSGREPDSAPGSLSPARVESKREPAPAQIGQPEGGYPAKEAGLRLRTATEAGLSCRKAGPPTLTFSFQPRIFAQPNKRICQRPGQATFGQERPNDRFINKEVISGGPSRFWAKSGPRPAPLDLSYGGRFHSDPTKI